MRKTLIASGLAVAVTAGAAFNAGPAQADTAARPVTVQVVQTTADKPLNLGSGAAPTTDAFVLLSDGSVSWTDSNCAPVLARAVGVATVPWPTIGSATRQDRTCAELTAMLPAAATPTPQTADGGPSYSTLVSSVQAATPLAAILTVTEHPLGSGQDGWGDLGGQRVWLSGANVSMLASHGVPVLTVPWERIAAMPQVPTPSVSLMDPGSNNRLGVANAQGSVLLVTPDLLLSRDAWLYNPSGRRQYVDPSTLSVLRTTTPVRVTAWNDIASLEMEPEPFSIDYINPASVPLQQTGNAPISPTSGGTVVSSDGVVLNVPPGVVPTATTGTVTAMSNGAWNVHINVVGWAGAVQVTLPTSDGISHQVGGQFIPEGTSTGQTTITVTTLSVFGKLKQAAMTATCLAQVVPILIARCVALKLVGLVAKDLINDTIRWVVSKVGNQLGLNRCVQELAVNAISGVINGNPKQLAVFASDTANFLKTLNRDACVATAGDPNGSGSTPPAPAPQPAPAPAAQPAPTPVGASISASKGAYNGNGAFYINVRVNNFPTGTFTYQCIDSTGVFYSNRVTVTNPNQGTWPGIFCWNFAPYVTRVVINGVSSNPVGM